MSNGNAVASDSEPREASSPPPAHSPGLQSGLQSILKHRPSKSASDAVRPDLLSPPQTAASSGTGTPLSRTSTISGNYQSRVAFDLLGEASKTGGGTGIDFSFTLSVKSLGYQKTKASREFLVATDLNEYSVNALTWLLENLVEDGDEVVVVRVVEPGSSAYKIMADPSAQEDARQEAQELMDSIVETNKDERELSLVVEYAVGRVEDVISKIIHVYRPDSLVVGTRGRAMTGWKASLMGSTSRYMLEKSPVPVVVVRPERKVNKDLQARRADPKRGFGTPASAASSRNSSPTRPPIDRAHSEEHERSKLSPSDGGSRTSPVGRPLSRPRTAPG